MYNKVFGLIVHMAYAEFRAVCTPPQNPFDPIDEI